MGKLKTFESFTAIPQLIFVIGLHGTTSKLFIKIGDVSIRGQYSHERRLDRTSHQRVPVHLLEPWMVADLVGTISAEPVFRIFLQQSH